MKLREIKNESEDRGGTLFGAFIVRVTQELKSSIADITDHVLLKMVGTADSRRALIVAHLPADAEEGEAKVLSSLLRKKLSAMARNERSPDLQTALEKAADSAYYNAVDWGDPTTAYFAGVTIWLPEVTGWLGYVGSQADFNKAVDQEVKKSTLTESNQATSEDAAIAVIAEFTHYLAELGFDATQTWESHMDGEADFFVWDCFDDDAAPLVARWWTKYRQQAVDKLKQLITKHPGASAHIEPDTLNAVDMDRNEVYGSENPFRLSVDMHATASNKERYEYLWNKLRKVSIT